MSRGTQDPLTASLSFTYRGVTLFAGPFQTSSIRHPCLIESPTTPYSRSEFRCPSSKSAVRCPISDCCIPSRDLHNCLPFKFSLFRTSDFGLRTSTSDFEPRTSSKVWALPSSLAATGGIDYSFSSSGYLDVSVPRVVLVSLWIQLTIAGHDSGWVAPFGYPRIEACLRLPVAFRC